MLVDLAAEASGLDRAELRRRNFVRPAQLPYVTQSKLVYDSGDFARILDLYFGGDMDAAPALAGQTVGLIDRVKSAQEIIDDTVNGFFEITERMARLTAQRSFG